MQTVVQRREDAHLPVELVHVRLEDVLHRWAVHARHHHLATTHGEDLGDGEALCARVTHDRHLVPGDVARPVPPEHSVLVERVHVRVPSPGEERCWVGYAFTT